MIKKLNIQNFKSHANTTINLSNVNILTGMNGMGKSSIIQSLLLLRQTFKQNMLHLGLELNDKLCKIGNVKDAHFQSAENDSISFMLELSESIYKWIFRVNDRGLKDTFIKLHSIPYENEQLNKLNLFNNNFQYISAFRNGPMEEYPKHTSAVELFKQISLIEGRCELVAHYLDYFKNDSIIHTSLLKNSKDDDERLLFQVKQWLAEISPDIQIFIEPLETSYKINYKFDRGTGKTPTDEFKAYNVGFGISYALPIIVAALHSPKDSIVIIENPEAHLHPDGQAKLMELICKSAKAGVQFILETHSDHIINGLLVAVKKEIITPDETNVYYFDREKTMHETKAILLPILLGGKIKRPPKGFFDRMDKDLDILMDMEKN